MRHILANGNLFLKVARHGKQPTVLSELVENEFREVHRWTTTPLGDLARDVRAAVKARAEQRHRENRRAPWCVVVDSYGIGGGLLDLLKDLKKRDETLPDDIWGRCEVVSG